MYSGNDHSFCDKIRDLPKRDAVDNLVDYFLDCSNVTCIDYSQDGNISLSSDMGKRISIDLNLGSRMLKKVENNYNSKRFQLLFDSLDSNCVYIFSLTDNNRRLVRTNGLRDDRGRKKLIFELSRGDDDVISQEEKMFLDKAVELISGSEYIKDENTSYFDGLEKFFNCRTIGDGGKLLVYSDSLKEYFNGKISRHNSKIKKKNVKQYKLEGLKR